MPFGKLYNGDLNSKLVWYSDYGEFFAIQMPGTIVVKYSDHPLVNQPVFRPPFEYRFAIQMPGTKVPGIIIANHLNNEQIKVRYSDPHCTY